MTIAWIVTRGQPHLMQAFRAAHWEIRVFSPDEFLQTQTSQFYPIEVIVFELSNDSLLDLYQEICSKKTAPILVLAADLAYAQAALEIGVDDFVVSPFHPIETLLRVRKLARAESVVRVGDLFIDLAARQVSFDGRHIPLSSIEFRLLACLAKRVGQTVSYTEIKEEVWEGETKYVALTQVKRSINRLRQKIEPDIHNPQYIVTISKYGCRLRNQRQWKARTHGPERINLPLYEEYSASLSREDLIASD
jgi:DNA-binding response OmpR family regulator